MRCMQLNRSREEIQVLENYFNFLIYIIIFKYC